MKVLRAVVLVIAAIEALAVAMLTWWGVSEGAGLRIAAPLATMALFVFLVAVLPAAVLAVMGRYVWVAALLVALPLALAAYGRFG